MPRVLCSGETMALLRPAVDGRLRHASQLELRVGGAESTVAIALARLGIDSGWISRVGEDELGELVLSRVRAEGVDVSQVARCSAPTGLYLRDVTVNGTRVFYYRRGSAASTLAPGALDPKSLQGADCLHLTGITPALSASCREFTDWIVQQARAQGVTISFDVNYRSKLWSAQQAREYIDSVLPSIDILYISDEEARALWQRDDRDLLPLLARQGPGQILLKRAGEQCDALIDGDYLSAPTFAVEAVDTTGAGDAFAAGYLAARLWESTPPRALQIAQAMGACSICGVGDYENLPGRSELMQFADGGQSLGR